MRIALVRIALGLNTKCKEPSAALDVATNLWNEAIQEAVAHVFRHVDTARRFMDACGLVTKSTHGRDWSCGLESLPGGCVDFEYEAVSRRAVHRMSRRVLLASEPCAPWRPASSAVARHAGHRKELSNDAQRTRVKHRRGDAPFGRGILGSVPSWLCVQERRITAREEFIVWAPRTQSRIRCAQLVIANQYDAALGVFKCAHAIGSCGNDKPVAHDLSDHRNDAIRKAGRKIQYTVWVSARRTQVAGLASGSPSSASLRKKPWKGAEPTKGEGRGHGTPNHRPARECFRQTCHFVLIWGRYGGAGVGHVVT